ncbi:MAG TPA: hypothetical protein VF379_07415 [Gaiellaceae bacterium]
MLLVSLGVLAAAALAGFVLNSATFSDADGFARAGRVLLSPHWRHTYSNSWLQAGPFEQVICLLGRTLGVTARGEPVALNMIGAAALLAVARRVLGADWKALLYVGAGATGLGVISDLYAIGHPSELFIALVWILAARAARRDALVWAALLLGFSAGFETWGLLGAPILFLLPTFRRSFAAGCLALGVAASIYAPFALGGDFHMFDLHWSVTGGLDGALFGENAPFTWQMRMTESLFVVGFGCVLAIALRHRTSAAVWIVPAATSIFRLFLDPVRYPYYWDTGLVLILIGTAPWLTAPRAFAQNLKQRVSASRVAGGLALLRPRHA